MKGLTGGDVPAKVLIKICSFLPVVSVCRLSQTCRRMHELYESPALWEVLVYTHMMVKSAASRQVQSGQYTWKELFIQHMYLGGSLKEEELVLSLLPDTPEYEYDKTSILTRMLTYFQRTRQMPQLLAKCEQLKAIHVAYHAFVEAAYCLLFQAALYQWSEIETPSGFTHVQLKERLYKTAVKYLGDGKHFELGVELLREMRGQWQQIAQRAGSVGCAKPSALLLNLTAKIQGAQALEEAFVKKAQMRGNLCEQYFFVDFSGKVDPRAQTLQDKQFVVRGTESEKLPHLVNRLQGRFPDARIINQITAEREGQCIYVHGCEPVKLTEGFAKQHGLPCSTVLFPTDMPLECKTYYQSTKVNVFVYSRPFVKGQPLSEQDKFSNLWICQYYLVTKDVFPHISRWSEIVKIVEVAKPPLQNARDSLEAKNIELLKVIEKVKQNPSNTNSLSMTLSGVVDAAVSGGVKHYTNSFLSKEYMASHLHEKRALEKFIFALHRQREVIAQGLELHKKVVPERMQSFHAKLEDFYAKWNNDMGQVCDEASIFLLQQTVPGARAANDNRLSMCSTGDEQSSSLRAMLEQYEASLEDKSKKHFLSLQCCSMLKEDNSSSSVKPSGDKPRQSGEGQANKEKEQPEHQQDQQKEQQQQEQEGEREQPAASSTSSRHGHHTRHRSSSLSSGSGKGVPRGPPPPIDLMTLQLSAMTRPLPVVTPPPPPPLLPTLPPLAAAAECGSQAAEACTATGVAASTSSGGDPLDDAKSTGSLDDDLCGDAQALFRAKKLSGSGLQLPPPSYDSESPVSELKSTVDAADYLLPHEDLVARLQADLIALRAIVDNMKALHRKELHKKADEVGYYKSREEAVIKRYLEDRRKLKKEFGSLRTDVEAAKGAVAEVLPQCGAAAERLTQAAITLESVHTRVIALEEEVSTKVSLRLRRTTSPSTLSTAPPSPSPEDGPHVTTTPPLPPALSRSSPPPSPSPPVPQSPRSVATSSPVASPVAASPLLKSGRRHHRTPSPKPPQ
eukprot:TRINITY_DN7239_c0_g1_i1.p1 TRINITY_DN7239_c0_g1~~TRINITY_DN7239_c0_g1_i1.p1  ORF type:complete len:1016 (-),score=292.79 TRINITY_DN7239_c0_g1_i1:96-3143(-)